MKNLNSPKNNKYIRLFTILICKIFPHSHIVKSRKQNLLYVLNNNGRSYKFI